MTERNSPLLGNLSGISALFLWASTALFLSYCNSVPPLLLTALSLLIGFFTFLIIWIVQKEKIVKNFQFPFIIILLAVFGIGGYRLLYFLSMHFVPVIEASLINYLWPAMIVLFSHFLPNEKLKWFHIVGTIIGFTGVCVLLSPDMNFLTGFSFGHILALLAALTWSIYSVISKKTKRYSSKVVPISFFISGTVFLTISYFSESWHNSISTTHYVPILFLGIASGVGYFLWDIGMKHGNIKLLGIGSFFVPLISTLLLILFNKAEPEGHILIATALIVFSAIIASKDKIQEILCSLRTFKKS